MKIYTKTGDNGNTSMLGGKRIKKSCLEIKTIGELDELNASVGLIRSKMSLEVNFAALIEQLGTIQENIFVIGAQIAALQSQDVKGLNLHPDATNQLEYSIDRLQSRLPPLSNFILPSGDEAAALCFFARSLCRRAERRLVSLTDQYEIPQNTRSYINRLSDYLFVLGRFVNKKKEIDEVVWKKQ